MRRGGHMLPIVGVGPLLARAAKLAMDGENEAALTLFKRVLQIDGTNVDALYGAAMVAWQLNEPDAAVRWFTTYIARRPHHAEARYNLGCVLQQIRRPVEAFAQYQAAIELDPKMGMAWGNLGTVLREMGDWEAAMECFQKGVELAPPNTKQHADATFNISYPLIVTGRWKEGWACYEARYDATAFRGVYLRSHVAPLWDGSQLYGQQLLYHAEQGFGDTLMCLRFVKELEKKGAVVSLEVPKQLTRLVRHSFPENAVYEQLQKLPAFDYQLPMMSAMHRLGIEVNTLPAPVPYLRGLPRDAHDPVEYPRLPEPRADAIKVGICWAGNPDHKQDRARSVPIEHWRPLWQIAGVQWFSLQVDHKITADIPVIELRPLITDFLDTAALIEQLDLVISVDTSVCHLAGALGKAVFCLQAASPDFRWLMDGSVTPWYPSMRLFRQRTLYRWDEVIARVGAVLQGFTTGEGASDEEAQQPAPPAAAADQNERAAEVSGDSEARGGNKG